MNGTVIYKNLAVYKLPKILGNFICFSGMHPNEGKGKDYTTQYFGRLYSTSRNSSFEASALYINLCVFLVLCTYLYRHWTEKI